MQKTKRESEVDVGVTILATRGMLSVDVPESTHFSRELKDGRLLIGLSESTGISNLSREVMALASMVNVPHLAAEISEIELRIGVYHETATCTVVLDADVTSAFRYRTKIIVVCYPCSAE